MLIAVYCMLYFIVLTIYSDSVLIVLDVGGRTFTSERGDVGDFVVKKKKSRGPSATIGTN